MTLKEFMAIYNTLHPKEKLNTREELFTPEEEEQMAEMLRKWG